MFKFFEAVVAIIGTVVDFTVSTITNIVMVIVQITAGLSTITAVIIYLPDIVQGIAIVIVSYCVIVNLLNKGG